MKKAFLLSLVALFATGFIFSTSVLGADIELAKKSTVEKILKRGELRVGFESGYVPFEMTDKRGNFIGFDMDYARHMAKAMGVKFVPVNTEWDGIIPALMTDKFDIIMGGMTITQERNLKVSFANPYIVVGQTILLNKKHEGKVLSYKDLNDPKFIVVSKPGTTGEEAVQRLIPNAIEPRAAIGHYDPANDKYGDRVNDLQPPDG